MGGQDPFLKTKDVIGEVGVPKGVPEPRDGTVARVKRPGVDVGKEGGPYTTHHKGHHFLTPSGPQTVIVQGYMSVPGVWEGRSPGPSVPARPL